LLADDFFDMANAHGKVLEVNALSAVVSSDRPAGLTIDTRLDVVTVVFDFVNPARPRRRLHHQGRLLGADERGI
jgi:hypothetical protein